MAYQEKDNPEIKKIVEEFRKHEDEFFKTAMSYVVRTNPNVKIFTASTPEIVAAVENVRGDVKLKKYYHQIPKKLGFKLVNMSKLNQIIKTRPGQADRSGRKTFNKAEKLIQKFSGAINKATGKGSSVKELIFSAVKSSNTNLIEDMMQAMEGKTPNVKKPLVPLSSDTIDTIIRHRVNNERLASAYHQYIEQLASIIKKAIQEKAKPETALKTFLDSKATEIMENVNRDTGVAGKIWWANRGTIFESVENRGTVITEEIKQLSRY